MAKASRGIQHDDGAVTAVLGQVLLVLSFVAVAGIVYALIEPPAPDPELHADLRTALDCADGAWGDANDVLRIEHLGGQPLFTNQTKILVSIGGVDTELEGMALGGPFSDGKMIIGERWESPDAPATGLPPGTPVSAAIVYTHEDGFTELLEPRMHRIGCGSVGVLPGAVFDPGFAYEDVNGDCLYSAGLDIPIPTADITDGNYEVDPADAHGLVIPPSVGTVDVGGTIRYASNGGCLYVGTELVTNNEDINWLDSDGGDVFLIDATFTAGKQIEIYSDGGDVTIDNLVAHSINEHFLVDAGSGDIDADNLDVTAHKMLTFTSTGAVNLDGSVLESENEDIVITAGSLSAQDADFHAAKFLTITTTAGDMNLEGTILTADNEQITLDKSSDGNILYITGAEIYEPNDNDAADVQPDHTQGVDGYPSVGDLD